MDNRAAKLALARKKLKDHQKKKDENVWNASQISIKEDNIINLIISGDDLETNKYDDIVEDSNDNFEKRKESCNPKVGEPNEIVPTSESSVNVTEMLITNKRTLELQISDLQTKYFDLESKYNVAVNNYNISNQTIQNIENDLRNMNAKFSNATEELLAKDTIIKELTALKTSLSEENNNYQEQLEFTKTILTSKENENSSLHSQLFNLQNQLDATQLQLQQLTNGSFAYLSNNKNNETEQIEGFLQKIASLEQQLKVLQKERDQMNLHYEHYVAELNEQLRSVMSRNEALTKETQELSNREYGLIEQLSDLEIRLQSYKTSSIKTEDKPDNNKYLEELQVKYENVQETYQTLCIKYEDINKQLEESNNKLKELSELKESEHEHDNISISKLTADIASDKIAAQRATEQNKKLKLDIQGLEDAFVKMTKDKLELTEKLTAEKYLNRELTIKLAEIDEKAKDMQIKLKAKDDEMIRLQANCRDLEKQLEKLQYVNLSNNNDNIIDIDKCSNNINNNSSVEECTHINDDKDHGTTCTESTFKHQCTLHENEDMVNNPNIPKQDAMVKLQERFLKIMEEVADLSDEKHRLEHIILQLQNETETICEYVALYQQQRSLLKRRDEERSAQMEMFESECAKLKRQLEELTAILVRFAEDKELSSYFQIESRHLDIQKIMNLLSNLKNNSLIDTEKKNQDFKNFHPCNCCSGKLIEV